MDLDDALAGDRERLDMIDAVDRRRVSALADQHDATLHVLGIEAVEAPGDVDDRDVDVREDVDNHAADGDETHQHDEHRRNGHGVRSPQRSLDEIDHLKSLLSDLVRSGLSPADSGRRRDARIALALLAHNPTRSIS